VAMMGTTSSSIDPLAIADVAAAHGLWLHVVPPTRVRSPAPGAAGAFAGWSVRFRRQPAQVALLTARCVVAADAADAGPAMPSRSCPSTCVR
jgi:hypothetical protein